MDLTYVLVQMVNGLKLGSVYAIVATGYCIVYSILRLINFAHGDIMCVGVYAAYMVLTVMMAPLPVAIGLAILTSVILGVVVERVAYRPLRTASEETVMMTSIAVSMFIQNLMTMIFSAQRQAFNLPEGLVQLHEIGRIKLSTMNIITFILTAVLLIGLNVVIRRTRIGMAMRACTDNQKAARLMGINVSTVVTFSFAVGSGLAAVAGIMLAGEYKTIDPLMGFVPGVKAFVAAVLGGIGSLSGAVLGGFIMGVAEMLFAGLLPKEIAVYRDALVFVILILVLLVRPNGLMGARSGRRS
jgi:branched-chain amino acid transport system permease protein